MADVFEHAEFIEVVIRRLDELGIEYMLAGSWASSVYGEPRQTLDVDIVINPLPGEVDKICRLFPEEEDFYVSLDAAREAVRRRHQFNVLHPPTGNKVDFIVAADDAWNRSQLKRRRRIFISPGLEGFASSPEDVMIAKMMYYREGRSQKHLNDCGNILVRSGHLIDMPYVREWAVKLGLLDIWELICQQARERSTN